MSDEKKSKLKRGTPKVKIENHVKWGDSQFHEARSHIRNISLENVLSCDTCEASWFQILYEDDLQLCRYKRWNRCMWNGLFRVLPTHSNEWDLIIFFGMDNNVSTEIRIVTYKERLYGPNAALTQRVISYAHLSDDRPQIAVTTFINMEQMFEDIYRWHELTENDYTIIIFITDGCAGQYKSGTALFVLAMHAQSSGKIFFR